MTTLTTNGDGKSVIEVSISDHVTTKTWNNSLSDVGDNRLIEPGSSVFTQRGELRRGDKVKFSGGLSSSETDCFERREHDAARLNERSRIYHAFPQHREAVIDTGSWISLHSRSAVSEPEAPDTSVAQKKKPRVRTQLSQYATRAAR